MKKTLLILAATLAVTGSAFARPCRDYRRPCRRPVVVEHHHYHKSHTWHREDWGKFIAGAALGWIANEARDYTPPRQVVYEPAPVYQPEPVYQQPVYQQPVYQSNVYQPEPVYQSTIVSPTYTQPVYETTPPSTTIISRPCAPVIQQSTTVNQRNTTINIIRPTTIVRNYGF